MPKAQSTHPLLPALQTTVDRLLSRFEFIPPKRKELLNDFSAFIENRVRYGEVTNLNFICTHNSRRSQVSQVWAQASAYYFGVPDIVCFSGGTEATEFNIRAVKAMRGVGFDIVSRATGKKNPRYEVYFAQGTNPLIAFSKRYDDPFNPATDFAAIITCSHADTNCPHIPGVTMRFALTYEDPKEFDNTSQEETRYRERVDQIGAEMLYTFSVVKESLERESW